MRILITNDDGIGAPALAPLAAWASQFGEVTVIAPRVEQSGKSHAIDFTRPIAEIRVNAKIFDLRVFFFSKFLPLSRKSPTLTLIFFLLIPRQFGKRE